MYLGLYTSHCTIKNQITYPSRFGKMTGKKLFVAPWFENSLVILPENSAQEVLDNLIQGSSALLPEVRELELVLYANAQEVELDTRNRFVLNKKLREYARLGKEAVFLGIKDRIELWDSQIYANYSAIRGKQIRETAINLYNRIVNQGKR